MNNHILCSDIKGEKMKNLNKKKKELIIQNNIEGVTLVALVVTIIVLIILAGVSINFILGDNGIVAKAKLAKEQTEKATLNEQISLNETYKYLEGMEENIYTNSISNEESETEKSKYNELKTEIDSLKEQINALNNKTVYPFIDSSKQVAKDASISKDGDYWTAPCDCIVYGVIRQSPIGLEKAIWASVDDVFVAAALNCQSSFSCIMKEGQKLIQHQSGDIVKINAFSLQ